MLSDFRKSIQSILYERLVSPLSGAFFISWFLWNWKIIFILFSNDNELDIIAKFNYIEANLSSLDHLVFFPILSVLCLILIYPFISTGALWVWLKFKKWQNDIKNDVEKQQLLTLEQSLELRFEVQNQGDRFENILKSKEQEISLLQSQNSALSKVIEEFRDNKSSTERESFNELDYQNDFDKFYQNKNLVNSYKAVAGYVQKGYSLAGLDLANEFLSYYVSNNLITQTEKLGKYDFTEKGKFFLKEIMDREFSQ